MAEVGRRTEVGGGGDGNGQRLRTRRRGGEHDGGRRRDVRRGGVDVGAAAARPLRRVALSECARWRAAPARPAREARPRATQPDRAALQHARARRARGVPPVRCRRGFSHRATDEPSLGPGALDIARAGGQDSSATHPSRRGLRAARRDAATPSLARTDNHRSGGRTCCRGAYKIRNAGSQLLAA